MPQKRVAVLPSEILHLERGCECGATTTLPLDKPKTDPTGELAGLVLHQCPWCNHHVEASLRTKIKALLEALRDLKAETSSVRLVLGEEEEIGKTRLK